MTSLGAYPMRDHQALFCFCVKPQSKAPISETSQDDSALGAGGWEGRGYSCHILLKPI